MSAVVVVTTVGEEERALAIAHELVARRLAACVNVVPNLRTTYRWQGKICRDTEFLLLIKTLREEYPGVAAAIRELHNYELPEILVFEAAEAEERFLAWIRDAVDKSHPHDEDEVEADLDDTAI